MARERLGCQQRRALPPVDDKSRFAGSLDQAAAWVPLPVPRLPLPATYRRQVALQCADARQQPAALSFCVRQHLLTLCDLTQQHSAQPRGARVAADRVAARPVGCELGRGGSVPSTTQQSSVARNAFEGRLRRAAAASLYKTRTRTYNACTAC